MPNYELGKINKTVKESNIRLCQYCGKEVDRRRIFCDEHNTDLNKQIYEFFVDIPLRPRGKYSYELIAAYLQSKIGLSKQKRFIIKAPSGSGKSITLDMIGYLELTHFPDSFTIIGSVSYPVATEHIRRIRHWIRNSVFGKYIHGMEATASKEEITLERLHSRMLAIASQAETSRAGYHPSLLLLDEVGRFRPQSYYQLFYQLGRSGGVLEIAGCYDDETEVLTEKGFKKFIDVLPNEKVGTMNLETEALEFQNPIQTFQYDWDGNMISIQIKGLDLLVTPNHNIFYRRIRGSRNNRKLASAYEYMEARDLIALPNFAQGPHIPRVPISTEGKEIKFFDVPKFDWTTNGKHFSLNQKKIPMDLWLEYLGYYLSEGWKEKRNRVGVAQLTYQTEMFDCCRKIASLFGRKGCEDEKQFRIQNPQLSFHVPLIKRIPPYVFACSLRQRQIFLDAFDLGDGTKAMTRRGEYMLNLNGLKEEKMADDFQILFTGMGIPSRKYRRPNSESRLYVWGAKLRFSHFDKRTKKIHEKYYKGRVYSLEVPNHTLVVRRNGMVSVSGNSTPFLDSKIMMEFWNADDVQRYALELEDAWWISKEQIRNAEKTLPPELFDQLYRAKFRSISNRVIPDDLFLESISRGAHLPQSQNLIMGVDFGQKIDPTAVVVIDLETGDIKFGMQFDDAWKIQFAKIRQIYNEWNPIKIMADSSSIGSVIISELSDLPIEGVSMHNDILKKRVIDRLTMAFINHKVNIVADEFPLLVSQLSSYVYLDQDHKKMGPSGRGHDDFVDALGLALMAFDVSSISDMKQADNIWTFTRVPGSNASPWKIGGF